MDGVEFDEAIERRAPLALDGLWTTLEWRRTDCRRRCDRNVRWRVAAQVEGPQEPRQVRGPPEPRPAVLRGAQPAQRRGASWAKAVKAKRVSAGVRSKARSFIPTVPFGPHMTL